MVFSGRDESGTYFGSVPTLSLYCTFIEGTASYDILTISCHRFSLLFLVGIALPVSCYISRTSSWFTSTRITTKQPHLVFVNPVSTVQSCKTVDLQEFPASSHDSTPARETIKSTHSSIPPTTTSTLCSLPMAGSLEEKKRKKKFHSFSPKLVFQPARSQIRK